MKTWTRLTTEEHCGSCGARIPIGDLICIIHLPDVKRAILRCEKCAAPDYPKEPTTP